MFNLKPVLEMKTFDVTVSVYKSVIITVDADNENDAEDRALETIEDLDTISVTDEYVQVIGVTELK